jgi:hypothetical protein
MIDRTQEKRFSRKNEEIMMDKIDSIIASLGRQDTEIAVIKTINGNTEEHLKVLNGKVLAHETRLQAQEGGAALNSQNLAKLVEESKTSRSFWERNWEKLFWFAIASGWAYFVTK